MENKIWVIKAIRAITNCGLKESLDIANAFEDGKATPEQTEIVTQAIKKADEIQEAAVIEHDKRKALESVYTLMLTKNEVLYLETILGRFQEPADETGDLSSDILSKLEDIDL